MLYKDAGVDISKTDSLISYLKKFSSEIGRFGGVFPLDDKMLVSSVDGVGTKLLVAISLKRHDTIGEDLVNHCVNDILCEGARPLFFMDYISVSKLRKSIFKSLISGLVRGCKNNGIALLGGETAELPSFFRGDIYDLVGFIVGIAEKRITGNNITEKDLLIGLPSNGLHTNGFSLVRKIIEEKNLSLKSYQPEFGHTIGEELLRTHRSYLSVISPFLPPSSSPCIIKGMAHITGGGFYGNINRIVPEEYGVVINKSSWEIPPVFKFIKKIGNVPEDEMYRVFNMGIGIVLIVDRNSAGFVLDKAEEGLVIGEVKKGKGVSLIF